MATQNHTVSVNLLPRMRVPAVTEVCLAHAPGAFIGSGLGVASSGVMETV